MKITQSGKVKAFIALLTLVTSTLASATSVAIVGGDQWYTSNLANNLTAKGNTVTVITSYTGASLAGYDAVVQDGNAFADFGALSSYANAGGRVIEVPWAWNNYSPSSELSIFSQGGSAQFGISFPGVSVLDSSSYLLNGVSFPDAGSVTIGRTAGNSFVSGVTQVASWLDGTAFIGARSLGAGQVIGINMHVITSDSNPYVIDQAWATQLFVNAVGGTANNVPEPESIVLLGLGLAALMLVRRRQSQV